MKHENHNVKERLIFIKLLLNRKFSTNISFPHVLSSPYFSDYIPHKWLTHCPIYRLRVSHHARLFTASPNETFINITRGAISCKQPPGLTLTFSDLSCSQNHHHHHHHYPQRHHHHSLLGYSPQLFTYVSIFFINP